MSGLHKNEKFQSEPGVPFGTKRASRLSRGILTAVGFLIGIAVAATGLLTWWGWHTWPKLPAVSELASWRPAMPLRIYGSDSELLAEYGQERREVIPFQDIPLTMRQALLAIEDARFYEHGPVDITGLARAAAANLLTGRHGQGGSTISMQLARNFYLTRDKTIERKLTEILLAWKLENEYGKNRLLELYMNEVYLGERAYGFAAAANIYFGKSIDRISLAEAAMLAGLPKAPAAYNPVVNPGRAKVRQAYVLKRMRELGYIDEAQYTTALTENVVLVSTRNPAVREAAYPVEAARQWVVQHYGDKAYTLGLNVYTTIRMPEQRQAVAALRSGLLALQNARGYQPVKRVSLAAREPDTDTVKSLLADVHDNSDLKAGLIYRHSGGTVFATLRDGTKIEVNGLSKDMSDAVRPRGTIVYVRADERGRWKLAQLPEMEGALVSLDAQNGEIVALVGGFDYTRNQYDHASQAYRQPGSAFKPFVYSAALERGYFPGTLVDDTQRLIGKDATAAQTWRPRNFNNNYEGFITARRGFVRSKNLVAVGLMQAAGADYVQEWALGFGFDASRNPVSLPLALGAGAATPLQMATSYAVFANGGMQTTSTLIREVRNREGQVLYHAARPDPKRVISTRNAWLMDGMLREVAREGTARSTRVLTREDVAGKTGTSNDAHDAWFAGYAGNLVSVVWVGYDRPRSLGGNRTGGTVALPVWINYMKTVLPGRPEVIPAQPDGLVMKDGDYIYSEYAGEACLDDNNVFIKSRIKCTADIADATRLPGQLTSRPQSTSDPVVQPVDDAEREQILKFF